MRLAVILLGDKVRERDRLAELLQAAGQSRRNAIGPCLRHAADRGSLPPLRRASRPRLRRRAETDRFALLHGWSCTGIPSRHADAELSDVIPAIVARPANVPRLWCRGFLFKQLKLLTF